MINIAFCFELDSILDDVQQEIIKGFSRRGIFLRTLPANHPSQLLDYAAQGILPDILLFSQQAYTQELLDTILFLKEQKHSMISILAKDSDSISDSIMEEYHFLMQPFLKTSFSSHHQLWSCVCKAYDLAIGGKDIFAYYHRPSYHSTPLNHILYFASEGRCVRLVTRNGSDSFYGRLGELEQSLSLKNCEFIRIHQSYLVNARFIASYSHKSLTLINGQALTISKSDYYKEVKRILHKRK